MKRKLIIVLLMCVAGIENSFAAPAAQTMEAQGATFQKALDQVYVNCETLMKKRLELYYMDGVKVKVDVDVVTITTHENSTNIFGVCKGITESYGSSFIDD